jgi:aspartyl-tRNA(Asn)/glutamyl-tRNA(Gln) amidotransferase subunit A
MASLIPAGNLAGLPAISIPCGFVAGMPVGLQIVGTPFSENTLLALAREFQNRTDWHKRRPPAMAS